MVEEILVKENLSAEEIKAGKELLERLDRSDADVIAAYWIYTPEINVWHLEFVSPQVVSKGPLEFYKKIREQLSAEPKLPYWLDLNVINVLGPDYSFYKMLKAAVKYEKELSEIKVKRFVVGDQLVDLYIYRFPAKRRSSQRKAKHGSTRNGRMYGLGRHD